MKVTITKSKPTTKPIREYETCFIYVGCKYRYDTYTKTLSSIEKHTDGSITYTEMPSDSAVFSRGYSSENMRVIVYSDSPKIWCEEIAVDDYFVFTETLGIQHVTRTS